ncbi:MAG TPA: glycoside hydrolase [Deltaproteobacteria bacterium]|nr:glycoside hydrolase [Deltaproteobacteria bacterium]
MRGRLNIAFYWHMHQPVYKDPFTGEYILPWVLFHGTKDYYDMVAILEDFPQVRQTFNLVPSLIEQLGDYGSGGVSDRVRSVSAMKASELGPAARRFIVERFFQASWETMIRPFPRFWELLEKRGFSCDDAMLDAAARYFTEGDLLDLQVLYNLVWIDPTIREADGQLRRLVEKGRNFTEEDKRLVLDKQIEIINRIIPKYREMAESGVVELTTSPYYHPIMPLLCDRDAALEAMPDTPLPRNRFRHPEDAREQLRRAIALHEETFGRRPAGVWPSEGSVSMEVAKILIDEGIRWTATDEEILSHSLGRAVPRDVDGRTTDPFLYRPYHISIDAKDLSFVFRDRVLSDLIGFEYSKMDGERAAADMVSRLEFCRDLVEDPEEHVVSIILDGENAWEFYRRDGHDFLRALYTALTDHPGLRCVTLGEFLEGRTRREALPRLYAGSWINHSFRIWIGHSEDNRAWDILHDARAALVGAESEARERGVYEQEKARFEEAWKTLYAAEGSDWFWWYGDDHSSMNDRDFDLLFRRYVMKIYELIGVDPPVELEVPISTGEHAFAPAQEPSAFIEPAIDGEITNYYEWLAAGRIERVHYGGAMHKESHGGGLIEALYYGFSRDVLYFRLDYREDVDPREIEWSCVLNFIRPARLRAKLEVRGAEIEAAFVRRNEEAGRWSEPEPIGLAASGDVVEVGVPFDLLGAAPGDRIWLFLNVDAGEKGAERWPAKGFLSVEVPTEDFELRNWIV